MKTRTKRIIQIFSAVMLTIALMVPFFKTAVHAAKSTDIVTITVKDVEKGVTVMAYQIVKAEYKNGTVTGYVMADSLDQLGLKIEMKYASDCGENELFPEQMRFLYLMRT